MTIEQLLQNKSKIESLLSKTKEQIKEYDSGFKYIIETWNDGYQSFDLHTNQFSIIDIITEADGGDNYIIYIYTDDNNIHINNDAGSTYQLTKEQIVDEINSLKNTERL